VGRRCRFAVCHWCCVVRSLVWFVVFFFFQAEDGIRYLIVTGVQTWLFRSRNGALVDAKWLSAHSKELGVRLEEIEENAYELAGGKFNLASPKQIGEILFEKLKIPILKKERNVV